MTPDHHGASRFTGLLPTAQAELLAAQLDAVTPPASSYRDSDEPSGPAMRRADALMILVHTAAATGELPAHGGDRPQVHITVNYDTLLTGLGRVDVLGGHSLGGLSAADARHLACDADLIPVVLGTKSQPLDVGRKHRLFPTGIRTALALRDGGCAFPGCTARPASCEAHHIVPWWAGGTSCLGNAVLLCPHHHRLVEPDPQQSAESQWQVHLDPDTGKPWFTPPRHVDPARRARQHRRHLLREHLVSSTKAPPCPDEPEPPDLSRLEDLIARTAAVWQSAAPEGVACRASSR
ncbi:HNH endonuclease signature motif containing protein [Tessaracoccus sp. MC1865]|uniref:HNH endonuclease n=1 Tax=Tessaracoccus sp. MC1865 TaxID=2760310 RepID=UPI0021132C59|nr:HNH endonuclease signature motif containing protein [Tessaracoccus sp. MC1865]